VTPRRSLETVLFTDIVGSTERAVQLGDRAWHEVLDEHNAAVRREIHRFGGREINTTGDGFLAAFPRPALAIRCAWSIHEAVEALDLAIRAGVHMGAVEHHGLVVYESLSIGGQEPMASLRLARLRDRLGDGEEARRAYELVATAWQDPDPALEPLAAEARREASRTAQPAGS